jgi:hypothetical protein
LKPDAPADLDDLAGSIAASRPFGGCGFARLKAQVVEPRNSVRFDDER